MFPAFRRRNIPQGGAGRSKRREVAQIPRNRARARVPLRRQKLQQTADVPGRCPTKIFRPGPGRFRTNYFRRERGSVPKRRGRNARPRWSGKAFRQKVLSQKRNARRFSNPHRLPSLRNTYRGTLRQGSGNSGRNRGRQLSSVQPF